MPLASKNSGDKVVPPPTTEVSKFRFSRGTTFQILGLQINTRDYVSSLEFQLSFLLWSEIEHCLNKSGGSRGILDHIFQKNCMRSTDRRCPEADDDRYTYSRLIVPYGIQYDSNTRHFDLWSLAHRHGQSIEARGGEIDH